MLLRSVVYSRRFIAEKAGTVELMFLIGIGDLDQIHHQIIVISGHGYSHSPNQARDIYVPAAATCAIGAVQPSPAMPMRARHTHRLIGG
jgi:hypothetical protein